MTSELPSRDLMGELTDHWTTWSGPAEKIIAAYVSGRLFDREAKGLYERNPECITSGYGHHHTVSDHVDAGYCFTVIGPVEWLEETSR